MRKQSIIKSSMALLVVAAIGLSAVGSAAPGKARGGARKGIFEKLLTDVKTKSESDSTARSFEASLKTIERKCKELEATKDAEKLRIVKAVEKAASSLSEAISGSSDAKGAEMLEGVLVQMSDFKDAKTAENAASFMEEVRAKSNAQTSLEKTIEEVAKGRKIDPKDLARCEKTLSG